MQEFTIMIDGRQVAVSEGKTILEAALSEGIYIPHLCYHPDLPSSHGLKPRDHIYDGSQKIEGDNLDYEYEGCKLCLVEVEGEDEPALSCDRKVVPGMKIRTDTDRLVELRRKNLMPILRDHPHACLTCAQIEGCSREPCSANVDMAERCCPLLGRCELQKVAQFIGIHPETPRYRPSDQKTYKDHPFIDKTPYLCVSCLRCVRVCDDLKGVEALGFTVKNNRVITGHTSNDREFGGCKFCGSCVEVCPTGALTDRDVTFAERERGLVPCEHACPAGINVPLYIEYIARGEFHKARAVVREKVPFPNVLGRVCFHPCEDVCRRSELSDPISICALKDAAFQEDEDHHPLLNREVESTGKKVAIIGAGPAGLTTAYYLTRKGHSVVVYEANEEPGGMLRYGIPAYRLPKEILEKDIGFIKSSGVKIETGKELGRDISLSTLLDDGFDSIFIATGAWSSKRLSIEGIDLKGVEYGVDLLVEQAKGLLANDYLKGKEVVVIGGGNVAVDSARTAIRLGAERCMIVCLEKREEMPAYSWEIEEAETEGIEIMNGWGPSKISGEGGAVSEIVLKECTRVFDELGNFKPEYDESMTKKIKADAVIISIGQEQNTEFTKEIPEIKIEANKTISVNEASLATDHAGIFAGGDAISLPASVIEAIASGRKAAMSIDKYLGGDGDISEKLVVDEELGLYIGKTEGFRFLKRLPQALQPPGERARSFTSFVTSYAFDDAVKEAERCLKCHQRFRIHDVVLPPEKWLLFDEENVKDVPEKAGVYRLLDDEKKVIFVCGTQNLKHALEEDLGAKDAAAFSITKRTRCTPSARAS